MSSGVAEEAELAVHTAGMRETQPIADPEPLAAVGMVSVAIRNGRWRLRIGP
jgi:hypothetical protein